MLRFPLKILPVFICIAAFSATESSAAREHKIRVLIYEAKNIYFKSDKEKKFLVKGIGNGWVSKRSIRFKIENGLLKYSIKGYPSKWAKIKSNRELIIRSRDPRGIWLGKRRYAGEIRVLNNGNSLLVINHLSLDKYLKSVVGGEMPKDWPMEALKAQAVAARTYALNQLKGKGNYDLDSNISSQVYLGMESETSRTQKAVSYTNNLVLIYNGRLIDAVFHSSSGGKTEDSQSVWGRYNPYLVSVIDYDQKSPNYAWIKKISNKSLERKFPTIGGVNSIRIIEKTDTDRIKKVKIYGPKGNLFLSGKELRNILELKSTLVSFEFVQKPLPKISGKNIFENSSYNLNSINYKQKVANKKTFTIDDLNKLPPLPENDFLLVKGSGSGHGVGMSQWGAKGLAEKGAGFRKILTHFYKGATVSKFYNN